jgi:hypothetical protein
MMSITVADKCTTFHKLLDAGCFRPRDTQSTEREHHVDHTPRN